MLTSKGLSQWLSRACSGQPSASTQPQISCQELSLVERGEGRQATGVVACEAAWMYGTLVCTHALKMEGVKFVWGAHVFLRDVLYAQPCLLRGGFKCGWCARGCGGGLSWAHALSSAGVKHSLDCSLGKHSIM